MTSGRGGGGRTAVAGERAVLRLLSRPIAINVNTRASPSVQAVLRRGPVRNASTFTARFLQSRRRRGRR